METQTPTLRSRFEILMQEQPKLRLRDAAHSLQSTEAELVEAQVTGKATRLQADFQGILQVVPSLGKVMALTRNEAVVHERKGPYRDVSFSGHVGLVLGEDIDLRLFLHAWTYAFAVEDDKNTSLQFFDAQGVAVHKIFLQPTSNRVAFDALVEQFQEEHPLPLQILPPKEKNTEIADAEIDVLAFQEAWKNLQDTHDFFPLLRKFKLTRTQALRLAPAGFVAPISIDGLTRVMENAIEQQVEIMVFVGNAGCIQIHTGAIHSWKPMGPWLNVLDPDFNLHVRSDLVASAFLVKKPTADGIVTSLELFDANGEQIVQFFGKRKPGKPELPAWRSLLQSFL
ncbi:MAG: hemin-degrading factor [Spirosomataceae bacterium]